MRKRVEVNGFVGLATIGVRGLVDLEELVNEKEIPIITTENGRILTYHFRVIPTMEEEGERAHVLVAIQDSKKTRRGLHTTVVYTYGSDQGDVISFNRQMCGWFGVYSLERSEIDGNVTEFVEKYLKALINVNLVK